jgi:hypothetical protein
MKRCAVHECENDGTESFIIVGRRKIFGKGHKVKVATAICAEHNAAVAAGGMCTYADPPGTLWVTDSRGSTA